MPGFETITSNINTAHLVNSPFQNGSYFLKRKKFKNLAQLDIVLKLLSGKDSSLLSSVSSNRWGLRTRKRWLSKPQTYIIYVISKSWMF